MASRQVRRDIEVEKDTVPKMTTHFEALPQPQPQPQPPQLGEAHHVDTASSRECHEAAQDDDALGERRQHQLEDIANFNSQPQQNYSIMLLKKQRIWADGLIMIMPLVSSQPHEKSQQQVSETETEQQAPEDNPLREGGFPRILLRRIHPDMWAIKLLGILRSTLLRVQHRMPLKRPNLCQGYRVGHYHGRCRICN